MAKLLLSDFVESDKVHGLRQLIDILVECLFDSLEIVDWITGSICNDWCEGRPHHRFRVHDKIMYYCLGTHQLTMGFAVTRLFIRIEFAVFEVTLTNVSFSSSITSLTLYGNEYGADRKYGTISTSSMLFFSSKLTVNWSFSPW